MQEALGECPFCRPSRQEGIGDGVMGVINTLTEQSDNGFVQYTTAPR